MTATVAPAKFPRAAMAPAERPPTPHLRALTGLRLVAALLVVMFHFLTIHPSAGAGPWPVIARIGAHVVASGYTGVSFFFLLSGFILAYTYLDAQGRLRVTRSGFWWARVARIYPVYALAILVSFVPYQQWGAWHEQFCVGGHPFLEGNRPLVTWLGAIFMLQAWLPCSMTWNAPAWSLSVEAVFYLLFPLIALGTARLRWRGLLVCAVGAWALTLAAALAYLALSLDASAMRTAWWERYWAWIFYSNPLLRLPEFLIGIALGRLFVTRTAMAAGPVRPVRPVRPTGPPRELSGPMALAGLLRARHVTVLAAAGIVAIWCLGPLPLMLFNQVLLDPLYAVLIYGLAFGEGPLAALFASSAIVLLGEASYAMYILHWPIRYWLGHYVPRLPLGTPPFLAASTVYFFVYLCVVIGLSVLSFRFVEQPARRVINQTVKRRR